MADEEKFKPTGHFADREIRTFAPFVQDGELDEAGVMEKWQLNERQIPGLRKELEAAGYLKKEQTMAAPFPEEPQRITAPLPEIEDHED